MPRKIAQFYLSSPSTDRSPEFMTLYRHFNAKFSLTPKDPMERLWIQGTEKILKKYLQNEHEKELLQPKYVLFQIYFGGLAYICNHYKLSIRHKPDKMYYAGLEVYYLLHHYYYDHSRSFGLDAERLAFQDIITEFLRANRDYLDESLALKEKYNLDHYLIEKTHYQYNLTFEHVAGTQIGKLQLRRNSKDYLELETLCEKLRLHLISDNFNKEEKKSYLRQCTRDSEELEKKIKNRTSLFNVTHDFSFILRLISPEHESNPKLKQIMKTVSALITIYEDILDQNAKAKNDFFSKIEKHLLSQAEIDREMAKINQFTKKREAFLSKKGKKIE